MLNFDLYRSTWVYMVLFGFMLFYFLRRSTFYVVPLFYVAPFGLMLFYFFMLFYSDLVVLPFMSFYLDLVVLPFYVVLLFYVALFGFMFYTFYVVPLGNCVQRYCFFCIYANKNRIFLQFY